MAIEAKANRTQRPLQKEKSWEVNAIFGKLTVLLAAAELLMQSAAFKKTQAAQENQVEHTLDTTFLCTRTHKAAYKNTQGCLHLCDIFGGRLHIATTLATYRKARDWIVQAKDLNPQASRVSSCHACCRC